jgi:hypothetical protein
VWTQSPRKRAKARDKEEGKRLSKGRRVHQGKGRLCSRASRHINKELQSIQVWLLLYQVHLYFLSLLYLCFEVSKYIHPSLTGFSHGGFSRVMLTKNMMCSFVMHA